MRSEKILITGSGGFIGSYLRKALPNAVGLDVSKSPTTDIVGDVLSGDIDATEYDVIYHLASIVGSEAGKRHPIGTYKMNVCGTLKLIEPYRGLFVFLSTVGVYEPLKNPYFLSKYVCEEIVNASSCKHVILRPANPYGLGSRSVVQKWIESDKIVIYGDGNQTRDFVYIDDLIDVLVNVSKLKVNRTYSVGTGKPTTLNELADLIVELTGKKTVEHLPAREFEIYEPVIKPDIVCRTSLREGILRSLGKKIT